MPLTHNQINRLWYSPSYTNFKNNGFNKVIFTQNDAEAFLRTGAYLIKEADNRSNIHIPWDEQGRYEILANPRLENAFVSLGAEYLLKGTFLIKGYAINKPKLLFTSLQHPLKVGGNRSKFTMNEVQDLSYIVNHVEKLVDFSEFDESQKNEEKKAVAESKGQRLKGITRMTIPFPNARQLLEYILFKRNYALHRPFIIPEFRGTTQHIFRLLDYIAQKSSGRTIKDLAELNDKI
ncbi:hypothetical protein A2Z67_05910 [Candidatus Woesebacteria bacterium RBG_13_36_22]|uniref:Uncharacterized protein n=1 Tax=Candidatus Woesebacteria bacterium RBG_13_36_22 TaxID=1802478 RepID=A0A1F7X1Y5_9BACT|nr:MAG: hypothetical protein A2Z67_05910 [Candidatus Woesebacteria bacterium RBG_13_36_22]